MAPSGIADFSDRKRKDLLVLAEETELNTLIRAINVLSEAEAKAKWSTYPEVFLEVALVKLCEPSMDASLEGIRDRLSRLEEIVLKGGMVINTGGRDKKAGPIGRIPQAAAADDSEGSEGECAGKQEKNKGDGAAHEKEVDAGDYDGNKAAGEGGGSRGAYAVECGGQEDGMPAGQGNSGTATGDRCGTEDISLQQMEAAWDSVLKHLEKHKKGLYTVLKSSRPMEINEGLLVVGCEAMQDICYDIANSKENRDALRDAVHSVTKARLEIMIENIDRQEETPHKGIQEDCSLYEEAVSIFGSELVERLDDKDN